MSVSAGVVADIVRLRAMGRSYRQIADYLDRKRVAPPRATSWSAMTVRNAWEREQRRVLAAAEDLRSVNYPA